MQDTGQEVVILVTDCRYWKPVDQMRRELSRFNVVLVIHGGCTGVDSVADSISKELDIPVMPLPAEWKLYGKRAGIKRNEDMVKLLSRLSQERHYRKLVLVFHQDLSRSKGTADCIKRAKKANIEVKVIDK